jgi:hypothetical protein
VQQVGSIGAFSRRAELEIGPVQVHIGQMDDEWHEKLECPQCRRTGLASLSQGTADVPTVHAVPDGFKVVQTSYGPNFHCATCDIAVQP